MGNIVKFSTPVSVNSIKSGGFNIGVNGTPADLTGFYTGICPINGGYTIYIDKASNGPSIYTPNNDTQLINITKGLGGNVTTAAEALVWINSQSNMTVVNSNYPSIVTNGLVMDLDAGFVSSYPKGGTGWRDLSGNGNNGTLINGVGFSGGSMVFDGSGKRATTQSSLSSTFLTASIWYKRDDIVSSSTWRTILATLSTNIHHLILQNTTRILGIFDGSFRSFGFTPPNDGLYHNLCVVYQSGVNATLYVDGVFISTVSTTLNFSTSPIGSIGNWSGSDYWSGYISQAQIYNRALTPQEVLQNYYAGLQRFIPTDGLVLSLDAQNTNLYATSTTTAYDISGNGNNGALINGVQYVGDVDGSWRFDATDDRIYAVSNVLITNDFTFTVWAKRDGNSSTGIGGIFGNHIHTELSGANIYFSNNSTTVTMSAGNGVTRPAHNVSIPRLNTLWNFYVIRYSGTTYQLYFNGVLLDSRTAPVVQSLNTNKYSLGVWALSYLSEYYLNGKISQCSTYNRALTATEISTIYNATKSRYGL